MGASAIVDIRIEHGPAELGFPRQPLRLRNLTMLEWTDEPRGLDRLRAVIAVPPLLAPTLAAFAVLLPIALGSALLLVSPIFLVLAVAFVAIEIVTMRVLVRPFATQEVLEVDTRYVTISRGGALTGLWGRRQLVDCRVHEENLSAPTGWVRLFPGQRPVVVWGHDDAGTGRPFLAGVGTGLSREDAYSLLESLTEFCNSHATDPEFEYHGSGMALG